MKLEEIRLWRDAWQLYVNLKVEINELNEIGNKLQELTGNGNDFQFMDINSPFMDIDNPEEESDDDGSYVIQMIDGDGDIGWLREDSSGYSYYVHLDSSIKVVGCEDVASIYDKRNVEMVLDVTMRQLKREHLTSIARTVEVVKLNK